MVSELNSKEIKNLVNFIIQNNKFLIEKNKLPIALEIVGEAGIGKTSVIEQIASENDFHFVKKNLSELEELGD